MTEKEYREFLEAVAARHLHLGRERFGPGGSDLFRHDIEKLSCTYRFVQVVGERPDETTLYQPLGKELAKGYAQEIFSTLERTGVSDALDEHGEIIFAHLSKDVIPAEDAAFLREAGVREPESELVILVHHCRQLARSRNFRTSDVLKRASVHLAEVAKDLTDTPESGAIVEAKAKPKKYFNGIAKILSGAILGGGNLLIGTGFVVASGGAVGAAVITSCAAAIAAIGQGVGELPGE